jgi:hypothetical protein
MIDVHKHDQRRNRMKTGTIAVSAVLLLALVAPPLASAQSGNLSSLFDQPIK